MNFKTYTESTKVEVGDTVELTYDNPSDYRILRVAKITPNKIFLSYPTWDQHNKGFVVVSPKQIIGVHEKGYGYLPPAEPTLLPNFKDFLEAYLRGYEFESSYQTLEKRYYKLLNGVFSQFPITIYRGVYLPQGEKSLRKNNLGIYWTFNPSYASAVQTSDNPEDNTGHDLQMKGKNVFVLKASVDKKDIDWANTIECNLNAPGECEVRLKKLARPQLLSVKPVQKKGPYTY